MRLCRVKHPGADLAKGVQDPDDFIRQYDGSENPLGIGKTNRDWAKLLNKAGFTILKVENQFFPKRFIPFHSIIPNFLHFLLNKYFGTMVYFDLIKSK